MKFGIEGSRIGSV